MADLHQRRLRAPFGGCAVLERDHARADYGEWTPTQEGHGDGFTQQDDGKQDRGDRLKVRKD